MPDQDDRRINEHILIQMVDHGQVQGADERIGLARRHQRQAMRPALNHSGHGAKKRLNE